MRRYKVLLPLTVHTEDGAYGQGEEFQKEFTAEQEYENVRSGLLEIVPRRYKVIGESNVYGADPGEEFTAPLLMGAEAALIEGGSIEPIEESEPEPEDSPAPKPKRTRKGGKT